MWVTDGLGVTFTAYTDIWGVTIVRWHHPVKTWHDSNKALPSTVTQWGQWWDWQPNHQFEWREPKLLTKRLQMNQTAINKLSNCPKVSFKSISIQTNKQADVQYIDYRDKDKLYCSDRWTGSCADQSPVWSWGRWWWVVKRKKKRKKKQTEGGKQTSDLWSPAHCSECVAMI